MNIVSRNIPQNIDTGLYAQYILISSKVIYYIVCVMDSLSGVDKGQ